MSNQTILQIVISSVCILFLTACSHNRLSVGISSVFIESRVEALNREDDLAKVRRQLLENISQLESMLAVDRSNKKLHIYAAQAYYSYAFAFAEDNNRQRASQLYYRAYQHARAVLELYGISADDLQGRTPQLKKKLNQLNGHSVSALYWTALSWAKVIEIKQPDILLSTQLHKTAILMQQVQKFDESYHLGGTYLFFAVYYGSRPFYLGGNDYLANKYFEQARRFNQNRLLMVDYLQARYLNGRLNGATKFNHRLMSILDAPDDLYPEQALMNAVAKQKAEWLLSVSHG